MSRSKKKNNRLPPFAYITKEMIASESFKQLTNASRVAYLLLVSQCRSNDQKEVKFPYSHAKEYMKTNTFARAIKQLAEKGFIVKEQSGGLYRRTNIYSFSNDWKERSECIGMADYRRATEKGSVKKWNFEQTTTEKGSVGK